MPNPTDAREDDEGWGWPANSKKAHYFTKSRRSLCLKWAYFGELDMDTSHLDCCAGCTKRFNKERKHAQSD